MDLTRSIIYRDFTLNDADIDDDTTGGGGTGTGIEGCVVDSVDMSDVDIVQFQEKKSQADGMDVGDPEKGARRIRMSGTLYAKSRPELFDARNNFKAALDAVLAAREEPLDHGYRSLFFSIPTARTDEFTDPLGIIDLQVKALPRASQIIDNRDQQGGADADALAVSWQATFVCRDPGIYGAEPVDVAFTATATVSSGVTGQNAGDTVTKVAHGLVNGDRVTFSSLTGGTGLSTGVTYYVRNKTNDTFQLSTTSAGAIVAITGDYSAMTYVKSSVAAANWTNRGNYLGKLNALIEVGAGAGTIVATVGDSVFTVTIPASTGNRIIRIKDDKVLTVEEDSVEAPRLNYITFTGDTTWPLIDPGESAYSITFHGMAGVKTGSHMWFYEQYAG
jgi:hypothetical protein